ncbi:MAG: zinc ABC transporter substrate-binding protein [Paracoccaceae bacterium]
MRPLLAAFTFLAALPATAEPQVVTDIAPVHSLVAQVMGDLGTPALLLDASADPHHITLRPSQARALAGADVVFWIGPALTPWLAKSVAALPDHAQSVALTDLAGTRLIELTASQIDPHAWLDPDNATLWLAVIADTLAGLDPDNAATYAANAKAAAENLQTLAADLGAQLAPLGDAHFLVAHDAYGYFARRFGLNLTEAISDTDAAAPSAARLAALHAIVPAITCAFREPQQSPAALDTLLAGTDIPQTTLDPLGTTLPPGPALYPDLIRAMADAITTCAAH